MMVSGAGGRYPRSLAARRSVPRLFLPPSTYHLAEPQSANPMRVDNTRPVLEFFHRKPVALARLLQRYSTGANGIDNLPFSARNPAAGIRRRRLIRAPALL